MTEQCPEFGAGRLSSFIAFQWSSVLLGSGKTQRRRNERKANRCNQYALVLGMEEAKAHRETSMNVTWSVRACAVPQPSPSSRRLGQQRLCFHDAKRTHSEDDSIYTCPTAFHPTSRVHSGELPPHRRPRRHQTRCTTGRPSTGFHRCRLPRMTDAATSQELEVACAGRVTLH